MRGHQALREYCIRQWTHIDPRVEPQRFTADNAGRTVVEARQVVRDLAGRVFLGGHPSPAIGSDQALCATTLDGIMSPPGA